MLNTSEIIDRLCGTFEPMHQHWNALMPSESLLWEQTKGKQAMMILAEDMNHIGHFFADCDDIGQQAEYALIAECLAHIKLRDSKLPKQKVFDAEVEKALREVNDYFDKNPAPLMQSAPEFKAPLAWKMAHQLTFEYGKVSPAALDALKSCYGQIADLFLLRDGNLTPEEDEQLRIFNAAFGQ